MNSFLVRRLIPFYVFAILCEFLYKIGLTIYHYNEFDFSFFAVIKTIGILSLTASVSFIFMVIPYIAYLLFLPANKVGSKADKYITLLFFASFVFITYFELISSAIFGTNFHRLSTLLLSIT
jgi:hypothetical protein